MAIDGYPLTKDITGVDATVFAHALSDGIPYVTVATDDTPAQIAAVAIGDGSVLSGSIAPALLPQPQRSIERNRPALMSFWLAEIDPSDLSDCLAWRD